VDLLGEWLEPDPQTLWFVGFWALMAAFAWLETLSPAFRGPPMRAQRWPTNFGFGVINTLLIPLAPVSAVIAAQWASSNDFGLLNLLKAPWWVTVAATIIVRSLAGYVFHFVMHKVPLFWRLHRVHHSDVHLDVSTAVRSHPVELVALILTMGVLALVFGLEPWALAFYEIAENAINLAAHANLRLPERIDRLLRLLFVTPNMHSLHHSSFQPETDSNYGQLFSVWDRLFGTYTVAPRRGFDGMQIGLEEVRDGRASDFWWQMKWPTLRSTRGAAK
jgi:sterol desaturase/sphingolipid hydroxylase (fatty acid hydroxylase superfamily)